MKYLEETRFGSAGRNSIVVFFGTMLVLIFSSVAPGQRGMGDSEGIARQMLKPHLVHISGKLQEIKVHPCANTTGKADLGIHLILKDKQGRELNVHLGPTPALSKTVKQLKKDRKIELIGFRTDKMPPNQYVAKTLIINKNIIQLRDSDLRPYWAGNGFAQEIFLPSTKAIVDKRSNCYYYSSPNSWQRRCFQNGQRPRWRRRCRGRFFCHEW
jgi:hypothetical protein